MFLVIKISKLLSTNECNFKTLHSVGQLVRTTLPRQIKYWSVVEALSAVRSLPTQGDPCLCEFVTFIHC